MVLIPLRRKSETGPAEAFGHSPAGKPHFGVEGARKFEFVSRLAKDRSGVAAIEYALLASLIAIAIVTGVENLGDEVGKAWDDIAEAVLGAGGP